MSKSQNQIPVTVDFDTSRIVTKNDADFFNWIKKNYGDAGAVPSLIYFLTSKMGKWNKKDLIREKEYFKNQDSVFATRAEELQREFKKLKEKNDADSQSKLLDVINGIIDCNNAAEQTKKVAEVFENFIPTNERAAEDLRKQKVGEKMKAARLAKGFSQTELGELVGVTKATISTYENGEREPPIKTLILIAKNLKISLDELFELR